MRFDVLTLFPAIFQGPLQESILKRAIDAGYLTIAVHNIRDYAADKHHLTDDVPYGGGGGMVMKSEPIFAAVEAILGVERRARNTGQGDSLAHQPSQAVFRALPSTSDVPQTPVILMTPQGRLFTQAVARELATWSHVILICGRYEGVDERVCQFLATDEISIGDYVLTGGELPALVVIDAVTRLLPGVLGDPGATLDDSHTAGLLEYPHYTRPADFRGHTVPDVLLSGHHAQVAHWRREQSLRRTWERRPDLLAKAHLSQADQEFLARLAQGDEPPSPSGVD
jgi:tRNA (guanine37-N1)-methyltransferase